MAGTKKTPFPPWQSAKKDGIESRFVRLGNSILIHPAYLELSSSAKVIYIYMLLESGGQKEFTFPLSKYKKIVTPRTFRTARDELISSGFIIVKQNNQNLRKPNVYEFSGQWKEHK